MESMTMTQQNLPAGFTIRGPVIDDVDEVAVLVSACSMADIGIESMSREDILGQWNDPQRNLEDEDWLVVAPDGRIVGFLELYEYPPYTVFEFDGYVHPEFTGLGTGSTLLNIIEQRARREMHRAPAGERVVLQTSAWSDNHGAHRLLGRHGYTHIRNWRQMLIEFDGPPPEPRWAAGVTARQFVQGQDERAVWETTEAAWQDHWGYAPMPLDEFTYYHIEAQPDFDPTLWFLAMEGEQVAGVLLGMSKRSGFPGAGWVSTLGVRREHRGRGIGLALLHEAFREFYRRGYAGVSLNVDGSSLTGADRLYERAGMREVRCRDIFEKELT